MKVFGGIGGDREQVHASAPRAGRASMKAWPQGDEDEDDDDDDDEEDDGEEAERFDDLCFRGGLDGAKRREHMN